MAKWGLYSADWLRYTDVRQSFSDGSVNRREYRSESINVSTQGEVTGRDEYVVLEELLDDVPGNQ